MQLDEITDTVLEAWRKRQIAERLAWGATWIDSGRIFTNEDGSELHPAEATELFNDLVDSAGLPPIRLHDLRHGAATMSLEADVDIKVVQDLLGHSTSVLTRDTYTSVSPRLARDAAERTAEPGVSSVAPNADGTGLSVSLRSTALVASAQLNTTMKVDRTYADPTSMSYSRENDIAPYYGGGDVSILGGDCSTGFAIWHAGVTSMLTAGHCANNGDAAYDGAFRFMGVVSGVDKAHDTAVINTPSVGRVWDGGAAGRGPTEFTKPVWAWRAAGSATGNACPAHAPARSAASRSGQST